MSAGAEEKDSEVKSDQANGNGEYLAATHETTFSQAVSGRY